MAVSNFYRGQSLEIIFPITVDGVSENFVDLADLKAYIIHAYSGEVLFQAAKETAAGYDTIEAYDTTNGRMLVEASETAAADIGLHLIKVEAEMSHADFDENFTDIGQTELLNFV